MKINKIKSKIPSSRRFQIVGIGASAGGLEAFKRFIKAIPQNSGMAYVLVQHLDPSHESLLPGLLQKITTIPVLEILENIKVKPDHIYVIPNNKMIIAGNGILKLIPRLSNKEQGSLPINMFFASLGEVHKSNAIGVVLSGNGSDGTIGLRAIKGHHGITFSQDYESAAYKGMPHSAAQAGVVDFILPPENIPQKILEITKSLNRDTAKTKNIVQHRNTRLASVQNRMVLNISNTSPVISIQHPDFQKMADHILLSKYSPTGIVVTGTMDIVYFRGHTANYLEQPPGRPSHNLLKMAKEGLAFELLNILNKVKKENAPVVTENFPFWKNGSLVNIAIEAIPLPNMIDPHYLILFHDKNATDDNRIAGSNKKITAKRKIDKDFVRIQHLELELALNREDMRIITEDLGAANEELQNANEELQSGSEELQSLNDELETSKDDLQNNNEELTSLNKALIGLNEQVTTERNYTESIIDTVWEPLLVLDKNFRIKSANNSFYKKFRLNKKQTEGVLIYDLGNKQWDIPKLHILLEEILPQKTRFTDYKVTQIFTGIGERVMQLNACEIIREKKEEKLILLSIQDITEKEQLQIKAKAFQRELEEKVKRRTIELQEANEELQQKNQEIALSKYNKRFIAEFSEKFSAYTTNNEFFNSLVQFIADTTRLDYVFVGVPGQTDSKGAVVQTIALSAFGKLIKNINYSLEGSPCEQVIFGTHYSFPGNCRQTFPKSKIIRRFNVEGYLGYPLKDDHGNSVGFIAVMHEKNIEDTETVSAVLKIVARRAEIELERIKHGKELVFQNAEKEKRSAELITANKELVFQNYEKEKRAAELIIANRELAFQNEEKEKRASELIIANKELAFQNEEKERRAMELNIANKELESFAYISSHDLQEPLRKIQTFASRILEKEYAVLSDRGKDYFNRMHSASKRMRTLIQDLLAYSRTNITERKFVKTDLNKIIAEVKNEFAEALVEKNAVIEAGKLHEAGINPFQFLQVMNNLVGNALKFSNAASPLHIKIKSKIAKGVHFQNENPAIPAGRLSPKKYYCHIAVTDNGIGFDPQYKDRIFEVFQRLHGNEEYEGTGIGLAIVKKIVEHHHGIITANSEIGKGSTFDIYVPA